MRSKISQSVWTAGIQTFFLENVPFSFGTGSQFAHLIVMFLSKYLEDNRSFNDFFQILELGAGLGYLGNHVLEEIECTRSLDDYQFEYTCTDSSHELAQYYAKHDGKVIFSVLDLMHWEQAQPCDFVILSYVLDSLPFYRFKVVGDVVYHLQISTSIPHDAYIFDYRVFPPKIMNAIEIRDYISNDHFHDYYINRQIIQIMDEHEQWMECDNKSFNRQSTDLHHVVDFHRYSGLADDTPFNYSLAIPKIVEKISESLGSEGCALIHDFGYFKPVDAWTGSYGAITFQALFFPQLQFCAEQFGFHFLSTDYPNGTSQFCFLYRGTSFGRVSAAFDDAFKTFHYSLLEKKVASLSIDNPPLVIETDVDQYFEPLNDWTKNDYYFLTNVGLYLINKDMHSLAYLYVSRSLNKYRSMALSSYYLLGILHRKTKQFEDAMAILKEGLLLAADYPYFHLELCLIALDRNQQIHFLEGISYGLRVLSQEDQIQMYEHIIRALISNKQYWMLSCFIRFINDLFDLNPTLHFSESFTNIWDQIKSDKKS